MWQGAAQAFEASDMKPPLLTILLFLLLGAVATMAVVWGCAAYFVDIVRLHSLSLTA